MLPGVFVVNHHTWLATGPEDCGLSHKNQDIIEYECGHTRKVISFCSELWKYHESLVYWKPSGIALGECSEFGSCVDQKLQ